MGESLETMSVLRTYGPLRDEHGWSWKDALERALELRQDVDALRALVHQRDERIAELEQQNRVLARLVFGRSSEQRSPAPLGSGLQGHLFIAEIAAEADRLSEAHRVIAPVEVPAHTRTRAKRRGEFPDHLPLVRTVCELKDEDRVCACGGLARTGADRDSDRARDRAHEVRVCHLPRGRNHRTVARQSDRQGAAGSRVLRPRDH